MKTQVKKWGDSMAIILNKDFVKYMNLEVGDWVDYTDLVKIEKREVRYGN